MPCPIRRLILAAGLLGALAGTGCATSISERDLRLQLREVAQPLARRGPQQLITVYAESRMVAFGLLTEARVEPASELSRGIGNQLKRAHRRRAHVVVGGPYPKLSDRILANALSLNADGQLRGLRVVFVSDTAPTSDLAEAARRARTRLYHLTPR